MAASDSPAPSPARAPGARHWSELDLLRALAGVCMVSNHAGVSWLSESAWRQGLNGAITFVGSLAPVLFFTVTGLGRGIQAAGRAPKPIADTLRKTLVLFLADAAFWLSPSQHFGLDFLGFIGLSALVLELRQGRRPVLAIALAFGACPGAPVRGGRQLRLPTEGGLGVRARTSIWATRLPMAQLLLAGGLTRCARRAALAWCRIGCAWRCRRACSAGAALSLPSAC